MLLSAVSVLVVAQSSSEIPEGLMNNPVYCTIIAPFTPISRNSLFTRLSSYNSYVVGFTYHLTNTNEVYKKEDRCHDTALNLFNRCEQLKQAYNIPWPDPLSDHSLMNRKYVSFRH